MVIKKAIATCGFLLLVVFILLPSAPEIDRAYVSVLYDKPWQGAIGDLGSTNSWGAQTGHAQFFNRPEDTAIWIISANAQKMDNSYDQLTIMIWYVDENGDHVTLAEASTSQPYGVVQVSCQIKKP